MTTFQSSHCTFNRAVIYYSFVYIGTLILHHIFVSVQMSVQFQPHNFVGFDSFYLLTGALQNTYAKTRSGASVKLFI
jgi:hypothetical protein